MGTPWIKLEHTTPDKPEVDAIAHRLGIDPDAAFGKAVRFWIWADQQTASGNRISVTKALLDRVAHCPGFTDALVSVGWLEEKSGAFSIPNFERHNGQSAKSRAETSRRVSDHRGKKNEKSLFVREFIPRPIRTVIFERDQRQCVYCGRKDGEFSPPETKADSVLSVDHVVPVSMGGNNTERNLVACCIVCNRFKGDRLPDQCGFSWPTDKNGKRFGNKIPLPELEREKDPFPSEKEEWFRNPDFAAAWKAWEKSRRKKAGQVQYADLEKLAAGSCETAIAILNQSTTKQYTGLFPLKGSANGSPKPSRTETLNRDAAELLRELRGDTQAADSPAFQAHGDLSASTGTGA